MGNSAPEIARTEIYRVSRTGDGRFVTSDLVTSQLVVRRFVKLPEAFRRMLFSFGGRVWVCYGGFQPANHMTLIFFCKT